MTTLNINGQNVQVDDSFLSLSHDEQNATVDEIAKSLGGGGSPQAPAAVAAAPAAAPKRGGLPSVDEFIRAVANGATFGLADRFAAGMGALTGVGGKQGDYSGNLQNEQARTDETAEEHPVLSTAADIVGGAAVPLGAIGAAGRAASLGGKMAIGAATGAGIGGVQGALSSRDLTDLPQTGIDALKGASVGGLIGGTLPGAGKVIGAGYSKIANALSARAPGISNRASSHLIDAATADGLPFVQQQMARLGPDAMLADAGPALLGKAQGAALNSDEGRSILTKALTDRNVATNSRIMGDVNSALGPAEDPQTVTNAIRAHRSAIDQRNYGLALGNTAPEVDTTNLLTDLGPMITGSVGMENRALTNLRDMLMTERQVPVVDPQTGYRMSDAHGNPVMETVPAPQTDPRILHKIKGELDNVIEYDAPGLGIPAAALSRQQGALKLMRGQLNNTLEQQVPGYAQANRASQALAQRGEAVEQGTQYLGAGKTTPSPDRFAADFAARAPGEQIAFAKGSRGNIDRVLGTKANDLQALRSELQGEGGWNAAKMGIVHGPDATDQLVNSVDRNLKFRDTYNKVVENSQTAQRKAAATAMKPTPASEIPLVNPNTSTLGLILTPAKWAWNHAYAAMRPDQTERYGEIAKVLTATGADRDAKLKALAAAISRRQSNAAMAPVVGDRAALAAAILANGYARGGPMRSRSQ